MDFKEIIRRRRCTRKFTDQQIKDEIIYEIVNEARNAPSWVNAQERKIYIATKEIAKKIREEYVEKARQGLIGVSDFSFTKKIEWSQQAQRNMTEFTRTMENLLGENYGDFVISQDTLFDALTIVKYPEILRKYLEIPQEEDIVIGIGIWHGDESAKINEYRSTRITLNQFMKFKK